MMDCFEAQKVIARHRNNAIVVTAETCCREWPQISSTPLDLPSRTAMGKAANFGLGLALAQPDRKVIVLDADGSLLMNLGCLVTIANIAPPNLIHFVFENGVYRTTGGQPTPNSGKVSFTGLAKASGYRYTYESDTLDNLDKTLAKVMNQAGLTFICLKIETRRDPSALSIPSAAETIARYNEFKKAAGIS